MSNGLAAIFAPIGHYKLLITSGQGEVGLAHHGQDSGGCQSLQWGFSRLFQEVHCIIKLFELIVTRETSFLFTEHVREGICLTIWRNTTT